MSFIPSRLRTPPSRRAGRPALRGWDDWGFAATASAAAVVTCLVGTFVVPGLLGSHRWLQLGDAPATVQSAQYVANGGLPWVYSANTQFLPLPGFLLILAPAAALGNHLGLLNSWPYPLRHPSIWPVVTPVFFVSGATAVLGMDFLAATLGVSRVRRRVVASAVAFVVVVPTCLASGHAEDLLCLALSATSLALLVRNRPVAASAVLAVAIVVQLWAVLLLPLLVVSSEPGRRCWTLVRACSLPAATAVPLMCLDFPDAWRSLAVQPMPDSHGQRLPWWLLTHQTTVLTDAGHVAVRAGSLPRSIAIVLAVAAAVVWRGRPEPRRVMAAASVALVVRGVFETQVWPYYLGPGAAMLLLGAAAFAPNRSWRWPVGAVAALAFYGVVAGAYVQETYPAALALLAMTASAGVALVATGPPRPSLMGEKWGRQERKLGTFSAKVAQALSRYADEASASEARAKSKTVERRRRKATGPDVCGRGSAGLPGALGPVSRTGGKGPTAARSQ